MNRETAIKLGLGLMSDKYDMDASAVIPQFVNFLYDSDNGEIRDLDIYPDPDMDATGLDETEECIETQYPERRSNKYMHSEINTLRGHVRDVLDEMDNFIMDIPKEEEIMDKEPRIIRRKREPKPIDITDEWMIESRDGSFDKYIMVEDENENEVILKLGLLSYAEGTEVKVTYLRVQE